MAKSSNRFLGNRLNEYIFAISPANRIWNRFLVVTAPNSRKYQLKLITPKKGIHHHRRNWLVWHRVQRQRRNRRMSRNRVWRSRFFRHSPSSYSRPCLAKLPHSGPLLPATLFTFDWTLLYLCPLATLSSESVLRDDFRFQFGYRQRLPLPLPLSLTTSLTATTTTSLWLLICVSCVSSACHPLLERIFGQLVSLACLTWFTFHYLPQDLYLAKTQLINTVTLVSDALGDTGRAQGLAGAHLVELDFGSSANVFAAGHSPFFRWSFDWSPTLFLPLSASPSKTVA